MRPRLTACACSLPLANSRRMTDSDDSDGESSASASTRASASSRASGSRGQPAQRGGGGGARGSSLQQHVQQAAVAKRIRELMHLAAPDAAAVMGMGVGKFRQVCRAVGIGRWPNRRPKGEAEESDE